MRRILGYLPQDFGVYPSVSAKEMLAHIAEMKGIANRTQRNAAVNEMLERVNLYDVRDKKLGTYSGGMKQRFGIAQALLGNPEIVIVDEPTAGLDPLERNRFYNLLSDIGENTIVILSTHIVEDVSTLCNDMAIIGNGRVLKYGKPTDIEKQLANRLWEKEIPKTRLVAYDAEFNIIASRFKAGQLIITVVADTLPDDDFQPKAPSLEDAYFELLTTQPLTSKTT